LFPPREPSIQVALDVLDLELALRIAKICAEEGIHVIELGTPLLKRYGSWIAKVFRAVIEDKPMVADLKIVDAAKLEIEPAVKSGANAVTVMGFADDEVVKECLETCRELGCSVVADLMYVRNPVQRALELYGLGIDAVCLHVGVDVQRRRGLSARDLLKEVETLAREGMVVAVAGGIKPENVCEFVSSGARIVIIGSGITKSSDPRSAARLAVKNLASCR